MGRIKTDATNSLLLSQLASDHKYDRLKQTDEWYKKYIEVMGNVGWDTLGVRTLLLSVFVNSLFNKEQKSSCYIHLVHCHNSYRSRSELHYSISE